MGFLSEIINLNDTVIDMLIGGFLLSILFAIVGSLVVVNRLVFVAGGISHASFGGVGLSFYIAYLLGMGQASISSTTASFGALGFALILTFILAVMTFRSKGSSDAVIGVMWALGMSIGIILVRLIPGNVIDIHTWLFGSLVYIVKTDLIILAILNLLAVGLMLFFYQGILAISYDQNFAQIRGLPAKFLYVLLLVITTVTVVLTMKYIGLILLIALMSIAPFIMEKIARSLISMMVGCVILNLIFCFFGIWLSYEKDFQTGPSIVLVAAVIFFTILAVNYLKSRIAQPSQA